MKQEEALAILLGRLSFDNLTKVRIFHLVKNGIDWYEFLNICVKKKLICMAYKNLLELGLIQLLPMVVVSNMQYHYEQNKKQNQKYIAASLPIIRHIKSNNILATPVKGLHFLNTIYKKDFGVRILNDIDFIVSTSDQLKINDFMKKLGYNIYLINDSDAFCSTRFNNKSYFYIKLEETATYERLRMDFNYDYSDDWIRLMQSSEAHIYHFLYLCNSYYEEVFNKSEYNNITTYNYIKLIDIHEYFIKYLTMYSKEKIYSYADTLNIKKQVDFTIICLNRLYTNFFDL